MRLLLLLLLVVSVTSYAGPPSQCSKPMHSDHIIYDCYGDWAVRHVFERGVLAHKYSDATTIMDVGWFGSTEFQINRRKDGSIYYIIPSQIDRIEMTIGGQVFVAEQGPSAVFYGAITELMLVAISQTESPVSLLIYSEGKTIEASFSATGSSAALRWIGAID
jgi:hypothetical protein|tara:strand:- start:2923 stop:3411 length:489 start_codon:yes stop_codon:yes gene_type:complete